MPKRSVLFVSATSEIGGADLSLLDLIRQLNREKFTPFVVFPFEGPLLDDFTKTGVKVLIDNTGYIRKSLNPIKIIVTIIKIFFSIFTIGRIIKRNNICIVHSNSSIVFGGALAAKLLGVKHVWHVREIKNSPKIIAWLIKRFIIYFSDEVIAISYAVKRNFEGILGYENKVSVIYDGIDLNEFHPREKSKDIKKEFNFKDGSKIVVAVGLILPLKGYDYFLRAAKIVKDQVAQAVFMIIGDNVTQRHDFYKQYIKDLTLKLGISNCVIFTGMRPDVASILSVADVSVLASVEPEGLGRVITESMAMAKPVVTTSLGGQAEIVENRINGIIVPPRDENTLAQAIIELLNNEELANRLGQEGLSKVRKLFNLNICVSKIEGIFESLC